MKHSFGNVNRGQMTLALPKALTFRVNVGNDGIEKGLVAALR